MKVVVKKVLSESLELNEANLSMKELGKRAGRLDTFIKKIETGSPFETIDGKQVVIDKSILDKFKELKKAGNFEDETILTIFGKNAILPTEDGQQIKITSLKKTNEFGGGTGRLGKETEAVGQLTELIDNALVECQSDSIVVRIKDKSGNILLEVDDITGVDPQGKVNGVDPKADFVLIRKDGKPTIYISHKDGSTPKDFGQWGGVTAKAGKDIYEHPEVRDFAEALKKSKFVEMVTIKGMQYPAMKREGTAGRKINDVGLKLMAIFGNDCLKDGSFDKESAGSAERVDVIAQGLFKLAKDPNEQNVYDLSCNHMMVRKAFKDDFGKGYEPILAARFMEGRANHGILNARMTIYTEAGRKIAEFI